MAMETASMDRPEHSAKRARAVVRLMAAVALSGLTGCHGSGVASAVTAAPSPQDAAPPAVVIERQPAPAPDSRPMMPGRIYAPGTGEVSCPSMEFETFLRAFANSGDMQLRYTARPVVYTVPYHDAHNTEPGDPAHPRWETVERNKPADDRFRYDSKLGTYIYDSSWLVPGQIWTGVDSEGRHVARPVVDLRIRDVSAGVAQVLLPNQVITFERRADCWYLTKDWSLDPFEGCDWPDQCRSQREYEAPYYEGD